MNGIVTAYDDVQGRGQVTLESGTVVRFTYDQVTYADERLRHGGNGRHGDGRVIRVGDSIEFDGAHASTPVRIVARVV